MSQQTPMRMGKKKVYTTALRPATAVAGIWGQNVLRREGSLAMARTHAHSSGLSDAQIGDQPGVD
eukprot:scaffold9141_cov70-Phaeocystis_antarctica.AAC.10